MSPTKIVTLTYVYHIPQKRLIIAIYKEKKVRKLLFLDVKDLNKISKTVILIP